jgi:hypothetical protein
MTTLSEQTIERPRDDAGQFTAAPEYRAVEVSNAVSEAVDKGERPADAFKPMDRITREPVEKPETFDSDQPGVRAAARELAERRQEQRPILQRGYHTDGDAEKPLRPATETVKLKDAARDLSELRQAEHDANEVLTKLDLANEINQFRDQQNKIERGEPTAQQVPTPQPESAPEATPATSLAQKYQALDPELKGAIEQQATAHETARQQYLGAVQQLGVSAWTNIMAQFPEMQTANPQQALEQLRVQNPQRFAEITGHLQKVRAIDAHWGQLQAQQQQRAAQQFSQFSAEADAEYNSYLSTRPEGERKKVQDNLEGMFKAYGIDPHELTKLYNSSPLVRSGAVQRMLHDLALYHAATQAASKRPAAPVPKVFRPGVGSDHVAGESVVVANAMRQFAAEPTAKNAGAALAAKRRAAALNRR